MWRRGTTSTCSGAAGLMSLKATVVGVSCTVSEGTSPATILQKRQSVMPGGRHPSAAAVVTGTNLPAPGSFP